MSVDFPQPEGAESTRNNGFVFCLLSVIFYPFFAFAAFDEEFLGCTPDYRRKEYKSNEVREGHEAVECIGKPPDDGDGEVGADSHNDYIENAIHHNDALFGSDEIFKASFGVVVPAEDRGEGEENERDHQEERSDEAGIREEGESFGESIDSDIDAL